MFLSSGKCTHCWILPAQMWDDRVGRRYLHRYVEEWGNPFIPLAMAEYLIITLLTIMMNEVQQSSRTSSRVLRMIQKVEQRWQMPSSQVRESNLVVVEIKRCVNILEEPDDEVT